MNEHITWHREFGSHGFHAVEGATRDGYDLTALCGKRAVRLATALESIPRDQRCRKCLAALKAREPAPEQSGSLFGEE